MIPRAYEPLDKYVQPNKVLLIYGPRRVGKTTLLQNYLATTPWTYKLDSGDNIQTQLLLSSQDFNQILPYVEGYQLLALDEAQEIPQIGKALKIIVDQVPDIRVITTGSSSFELAGQTGEPLTGRKRTLSLFPVAQAELLAPGTTYGHNRHELQQKLPDFLVYGSYPEVIEASTQQECVEFTMAESLSAHTRHRQQNATLFHATRFPEAGF
jgi:predicted AAA+ superfamily ATPase